MSGSDGEHIARLDHVTTDFGGGTRALDDVSVTFPTGEITMLLGSSGSGKSTLLRHLNGLQAPTSGVVDVLGRDVATLDRRGLRALRRDIGMVFQHFNLVGPMSVLENVCTGGLGTLRGPRVSLLMYPRSVRRAAWENLERVRMADRAHQRADTLSGGQQQRVAIARALMQRPWILLADEPVSALDPVSTSEVVGLLRDIAREEGLTVIGSLHQVQLALDVADRVVGLSRGRVVLDRASAGLTAEEASAVYTAGTGEGNR